MQYQNTVWKNLTTLLHIMATSIFQNRKPLQRLHCNHDYYWSVLKTFYRYTNHQEALAKWTEEEFGSNVVKVLSERLANGDKLDDQPLLVLGVGSGEGYQEIFQLKKLKTKFSQISATVVEPSTQRISEYQDIAGTKSSEFTGIQYEWHNQTFQEFVRSAGAERKYHFITIVHAVYFLGDVDRAIRYLYELLEPGGLIFMVVGREHTGKLSLTFPDQHTVAFKDQTPTTTTNNESPSVRTPNDLTCSADVMHVLNNNQMSYTRSFYIESTDVTACFTHKEPNLAKLLLDFITLSINFKESVSDEIFNQVMDFLRSNARVEKNDAGEDRFYIDNACDILVISK
ncbi:histamine N-methyltransferase-like [Amphiura filiformis]|uniref:histamine N-methyltransferase-like n=1 Tax=Amphiura filiformis TaxID=82378 RepID=UPI003B220F6E